ncbi:MAG: hypothetical protein K0Q70_2285 [Rhodospirillales bacterium]|nr:hypothetical protein [Rhodospirillales bacterium]
MPDVEDGVHTVEVARDGKPYAGTYVVEGDAVRVEYQGETKIAPLDGLDAKSRARMVLGEMVPSDLATLSANESGKRV